jgi:hypothetical protein
MKAELYQYFRMWRQNDLIEEMFTIILLCIFDGSLTTFGNQKMQIYRII